MTKIQSQTKANLRILPWFLRYLRHLNTHPFSLPHLNKQQSWLLSVLSTFTFGLLSSLITATPGLGAEEIEFTYPPFGDFSISTASLEAFAKEGKITNEFAFYAKRMEAQQLAQLRNLLKTRYEISPTLVSQFTYSGIGENLLKRLGELLLTENRQNGFYALRSALILSAADPEGLTLVNIIRRYPSAT
ncbi:hypothetical protein NUACC21_25920 [Scytonema sp. NUACC21]